MKTLSAQLPCPRCLNPMRPAALCCDACEVRVEATFQLNEFARLSPDDLHFLRTFINCEGRVREMETALGLSYPTIRARLSAFKERVSSPIGAPDSAPATSEPASAVDVLTQLQSGTLNYSEALERLRELKSETAKKGKKK